MGILANISSDQAMKAFERLGWAVDRQRGSHLVMAKPGHRANLAIPIRGEVAKGTLRNLIRTAGITVDDFLALL